MAQEQDGGFREGPFEMDVADLAAGGADPLACGFFGTLDQAGIGGKVLNAGEAADVVDLVEDCHGQDLADTGQRT